MSARAVATMEARRETRATATRTTTRRMRRCYSAGANSTRPRNGRIDITRHAASVPSAGAVHPFGTRSDFNAETGRLLAGSGYACAFTAQHGAIQPGSDPVALPRVKIEGGEGLAMFRLICAGGLDAWRAVDHALWRLQQERVEASDPS